MNLTMKKRTFYSEISYALGIVLLAAGTALTVRADFGVSMVVAPAYIIHLKVAEFLPAFSFGMAEICFQILILLLVAAIGKFRASTLFSFVTTLFYSLVLDGMTALAGFIPPPALAARIALFAAGLVLCALAIAFLFNTYVPPEAYEVFVLALSQKTGGRLGTVKTLYDLSSLVLAIALSFIFFGLGRFEGIGVGTVVAAFLNGPMIAGFKALLEKFFVFRPLFPKLAPKDKKPV